MKHALIGIALALFAATPVAALADFHLNVIQTHTLGPKLKWNAIVWARNGCSSSSRKCTGSGTFFITQDGEHYLAKTCELSVWPSERPAWNAVFTTNPNGICKTHWINENTVDLTIQN